MKNKTIQECTVDIGNQGASIEIPDYGHFPLSRKVCNEIKKQIKLKEELKEGWD